LKFNSLNDKYLSFIKQCYDKTAYYKFFLRTSDLIIFEFNKKGMLTFLSRPIPKDQKANFQIQFDPTMIQSGQLEYKQIFRENQSIVTSVENYLQ
jgi:hypothetical protein